MAQDNSPSGQLSDFVQMSSHGSSHSPEPPILSQYPETPVYEVNMMVQLVKVRPLTLWAWEQQLGISSAEPSHDPTGHKRRYSERDLVAMLWLRDMVIAGETPQDAAARLLAAQHGRGAPGSSSSGALTSGPLGGESHNIWAGLGEARGQGWTPTSGPLTNGAPFGPSGQLDPLYTSGGLGAATYSGTNPSMNSGSHYGSSGSPRPTQAGLSGQLDARSADPWNSGVYNSVAGTRPVGFSGPLAADPSAGGNQMAGPSGKLGSIYGPSLEQPNYATRRLNMSQSLVSLRELRPAVPHLLQSFARFDTARAGAVLMEALRRYGVEGVCIGLAQPAVARISELWSKSELTNPEERFALNYLRGFLLWVFHATQEPLGAPLAVVGCAPNETNEFSALLLAVMWRRAGLRVAYLGRGIDGDQLVQQRWPITPAIIALTATSTQRIRALARIGKKLGELPEPQPIFAFSGPIFVRNPDLKRKLNGQYLGDDLTTATHYVRQLLNMDIFGE